MRARRGGRGGAGAGMAAAVLVAALGACGDDAKPEVPLPPAPDATEAPAAEVPAPAESPPATGAQTGESPEEALARLEREIAGLRAARAQTERDLAARAAEVERLRASNPNLPTGRYPAGPRGRAALEEARRVLALPELRDLRFVERFADPWLVLQQYEPFEASDDLHKNPDRVAKAEHLAERDALLLTGLHRRFRELFGERFALPDLAAGGRVLVAAVGWDEPAFRRIHEAVAGTPPSPVLRSTYLRDEQTLLHYVGEEALRAQDELPSADDFVQKGSDQSLCYEAALQLVHETGAALRGRPLVRGERDDRPRRPVWFDFGFGEFMGAIEVDRPHLDGLDGATFRHNRLPLGRIATFREPHEARLQREAAKAWTLDRLALPTSDGEVLRDGARAGSYGGMALVTFSARAWCLVHFLWFHDNGRDRGRFLDYMEAVLRGEDGPEAFERTIRRGTAEERAALDAAFERWWDACLARRVGWKDPGRTKPWNTETGPPDPATAEGEDR